MGFSTSSIHKLQSILKIISMLLMWREVPRTFAKDHCVAIKFKNENNRTIIKKNQHCKIFKNCSFNQIASSVSFRCPRLLNRGVH